MNASRVPELRSCSRSTSPGRSRSSAALVAGSAAGISPSGPDEDAGQRPDRSTAWLVTPSSAAAASSGVVPAAAAGRAGSAPGTSPSGSDQVPDQKSNGTAGSARAIADRSVAAVEAGSPAANGPAAAR
jgi:hypothetical protein